MTSSLPGACTAGVGAAPLAHRPPPFLDARPGGPSGRQAAQPGSTRRMHFVECKYKPTEGLFMCAARPEASMRMFMGNAFKAFALEKDGGHMKSGNEH
eukprot:1160705-Pelagomonas_calceolata.AAC.10